MGTVTRGVVELLDFLIYLSTHTSLYHHGRVEAWPVRLLRQHWSVCYELLLSMLRSWNQRTIGRRRLHDVRFGFVHPHWQHHCQTASQGEDQGQVWHRGQLYRRPGTGHVLPNLLDSAD